MWKVEYVNGSIPEIKITNSDRHNGITIIPPNVFMENILNNYSTLQEAATN
jgi:hypothetical protein